MITTTKGIIYFPDGWWRRRRREWRRWCRPTWSLWRHQGWRLHRRGFAGLWIWPRIFCDPRLCGPRPMLRAEKLCLFAWFRYLDYLCEYQNPEEGWGFPHPRELYGDFQFHLHSPHFERDCDFCSHCVSGFGFGSCFRWGAVTASISPDWHFKDSK